LYFPFFLTSASYFCPSSFRSSLVSTLSSCSLSARSFMNSLYLPLLSQRLSCFGTAVVPLPFKILMSYPLIHYCSAVLLCTVLFLRLSLH
jgi:hypothetical protein